MKYNFDLIITDEELKANRQRHLQQDKDKRDNKIVITIAIVVSVLIILLLIHDNNKDYKEDLSKCENGTFQIMTAREYDNQIETFCK